MYVIALTGGIASGKTTLLTALFKHGAPVIDADQISRSLTAPGGQALPAIQAAFGDGVFAADGTLDRKTLAAIIFADEAARRKLETIIHPLVDWHIRQELQTLSAGYKAAIVDIPLLYEAGMESIANEVWCVYVPRQEQIRRLCARDRLTREQALLRLNSQMDPREKCRRADHVIRTDGTPEETAAKAVVLWQNVLNSLGGTHID